MYSTFGNFLRWSEVWALFFPLYQLLKTPNNSRSLRPVSYYVILAFILNLAANLISNQKSIGLFLPWHNNVIIYNIHSIVRFVCFSVFFTNLSLVYGRVTKKIIPLLYVVYLFLDLIFLDDFFGKTGIAADLLTGEAFLLLVYCLLYYLFKLTTDEKGLIFNADFYIVTGLSIFVVTNFFVFLFYKSLLSDDPELAVKMWSVHNIAFIIFSLCIAKGISIARSSVNLRPGEI